MLEDRHSWKRRLRDANPGAAGIASLDGEALRGQQSGESAIAAAQVQDAVCAEAPQKLDRRPRKITMRGVVSGRVPDEFLRCNRCEFICCRRLPHARLLSSAAS